jgi:hypothetical protein
VWIYTLRLQLPKKKQMVQSPGHTSVTVGVDTIEHAVPRLCVPTSLQTPFTSPTHMYTQHIKNGEYNLKKNKKIYCGSFNNIFLFFFIQLFHQV